MERYLVTAAHRSVDTVSYEIGRTFKTPFQYRKKMRDRRAKRKRLGHCVNHDGRPATHGCRCEACDEVHRKSR